VDVWQRWRAETRFDCNIYEWIVSYVDRLRQIRVMDSKTQLCINLQRQIVQLIAVEFVESRTTFNRVFIASPFTDLTDERLRIGRRLMWLRHQADRPPTEFALRHT
jgi:hypothetical protein